MEFVPFEKTEIFSSENAKIFEYNLKDKDINVCYCEINGRYPKTGCSINEKCKELAFVLSGNGKVIINNNEHLIKEKDVILINKDEKFFWEGNLKLILPCSPAWNSKQYKTIE